MSMGRRQKGMGVLTEPHRSNLGGDSMKIGDLVHSEWGKLGILMWPIEHDNKWMVYWSCGGRGSMWACYLHMGKIRGDK